MTAAGLLVREAVVSVFGAACEAAEAGPLAPRQAIAKGIAAIIGCRKAWVFGVIGLALVSPAREPSAALHRVLKKTLALVTSGRVDGV